MHPLVIVSSVLSSAPHAFAIWLVRRRVRLHSLAGNLHLRRDGRTLASGTSAWFFMTRFKRFRPLEFDMMTDWSETLLPLASDLAAELTLCKRIKLRKLVGCSLTFGEMHHMASGHHEEGWVAWRVRGKG